MNTNAIHNILNLIGLIVGALVTYDWTMLGFDAAQAAALAGWFILGDKTIKMALNISRDGMGGLFKPQPPVSRK
jgi:hypothetical protein